MYLAVTIVPFMLSILFLVVTQNMYTVQKSLHTMSSITIHTQPFVAAAMLAEVPNQLVEYIHDFPLHHAHDQDLVVLVSVV